MNPTKQPLAVVFALQSWDDLADMKNPERVSDDPENFNRCVARERGMELEFCQQIGIPVAFSVPKESDRMIRSTAFHKFLGESKIELEPGSAPEPDWGTGRLVLLRSHCNNQDSALAAILENGWEPAISQADADNCEAWLEWVKPEFLGRRIERMTMEEILQSDKLSKFAGDLEEVFLKTEEKSISGVCHPSEPLDVIEYNCALLPPNTPFLVSEPMHIHRDEYGTKEWRVWVANGKPTSYSRYLDYETGYETPDEVAAFAERFCQEHPEQPRAFVLDVAQTDQGVQVIEINGLQSSGRYAKNDFSAFVNQLANPPSENPTTH